jgi:hypothetical protein
MRSINPAVATDARLAPRVYFREGFIRMEAPVFLAPLLVEHDLGSQPGVERCLQNAHPNTLNQLYFARIAEPCGVRLMYTIEFQTTVHDGILYITLNNKR